MKFLFDILTSPLGLPINPIAEYIILVIVGGIVYRIAYAKVGEINDIFMINNSAILSIIHWTIRLMTFIPIWAILYGICYVIEFIISLF